MPQPCSSQTPCLANARISDSGTAAPPTSERMPARQLPAPGLLGERALVGLDQAHPDRRHAQRQRRRLELHQVEQVVRDAGAGRETPASTPIITAPYGTPQLLAWNIGVTGSSTSVAAQAPVVRRGSRPACAAPSSGASRPRPWRARSCPTCSTSPPDRSRRARRTRSRRGRRRPAGLRSRCSSPVTAAPENGNTITFSNACSRGELPIQRQQDVVDDQEAVLRVARRSSRSRRATGAG